MTDPWDERYEFTSMKTIKNQPFLQVNAPYMDGMGMSVQRFVVWVCQCLD